MSIADQPNQDVHLSQEDPAADSTDVEALRSAMPVACRASYGVEISLITVEEKKKGQKKSCEDICHDKQLTCLGELDTPRKKGKPGWSSECNESGGATRNVMKFCCCQS